VAHMHYTGTGKTHSFRGFLADGTQDKIRIQGPTGAIAWRITKLDLISEAPASTTQETVVKVFREDGETIDANINFSQDSLLAAGYFEGHSNSTTFGGTIIVFDGDLFVRDIYIMGVDGSGGVMPINYVIELEEVKVSKAGMAQLAVAAARRT